MAKQSLMGRISKAVKTSLAKGAIAAVDAMDGVEKSLEARLRKSRPAAAAVVRERLEPAVSAAKKAVRSATQETLAAGAAALPVKSAEKVEGAPPAPRGVAPPKERATRAAGKAATVPGTEPKAKRGQKHRHHR